jgi:hypothetical protein
MTITPDPQLEAALKAAAEQQKVSPEALALESLRQKFLPRPLPFEPQDEWERRLLSAASDCGVPNPGTNYGREEIYD